MVKKALKIALASGMILLTAGCWDSLPVEDRDICTAVLVDYSDGDYSFYVEVAAISSKIQGQRSEQGGGEIQDTNIIKASGKSFAEARIALDKLLNKPIFLGAVQALILTESMTDHGIEEYAYRVRQMIDYRKNMDVIVTPDDPADFLGIRPANESTVGFAVEDSLETMLKLGSTFHVSLAELLEKLASPNPCYLLSTLSVVDGQISLIGYTAFSGGTREGFIPYAESRGIICIVLGQSGGKAMFNYVVPLGDKQFSLETELTSFNVTPVYKDGTVEFHLNFGFKSTHLYPSSNDPITPQVENAIEAGLCQQLLQDISQAVALSQSYGCDYLSFSELFRIRYPDVFEQMDWESEFKRAVFSISVNVDILQTESVDYNPSGEGK